MGNYKNFTKETLLSAAYTLTGTEAEIGSEINTIGVRKLVLYVTVDINDSLNVRIRPNFRHTSGGTNYYPPLAVVGTTETKIQDNYFEIDTDADQYQTIEIELDGCVPYVQFSAWAGTAGSTAGILTDITYIKHMG